MTYLILTPDGKHCVALTMDKERVADILIDAKRPLLVKEVDKHPYAVADDLAKQDISVRSIE
jgi:hypothetical protein